MKNIDDLWQGMCLYMNPVCAAVTNLRGTKEKNGFKGFPPGVMILRNLMPTSEQPNQFSGPKPD